jgi:hypothetical protein
MADLPYEIEKGHYIFIEGDIITKANLEDYTG